MQIKPFFGILIFLAFCAQSPAQTEGLGAKEVAQNDSSYLKQCKSGGPDCLVPLRFYVQGLRLQFPYATRNNFVGEVLYKRPDAYLRMPAAEALARVQQRLKAKGLGLLVWDAYRPWSVTRRMWEVVPDERYAANPAKGSGHNRGISVDLTLVDANTGVQLPMPTGYDNFSDTAHYSFMQLPAFVLANRSLLRQAMEAEGFQALETEWWHFAYVGNGKKYPVMDLTFGLLKQSWRRKSTRNPLE